VLTLGTHSQPVAATLASQGRSKQGRQAWLQEWIFDRLHRGFNRAFGGRENVLTSNLVIDAGCGDVVQVWLENSFKM
jgi:hypothetical protein